MFINLAAEILEKQNPMTIRQLFYRMVGLNSYEKSAIGGFENDDRHYKLVSRMMTKAREDGRVPYRWIVDRSRPTRLLNTNVFSIQRLAIFSDDIKKFNLPPLRVKSSDTRHRSFLRDHGDECVELDALPPDELRRRIRTAVESVMDMDKWNRAVMVEQAEVASIVQTVSQWPGVANVD